MAVNLRRLRWVLEVDSREFDRQMGRVRGNFRRLARVATRAFAVFSAGQLFRGAINTTQELGKMADATGLTVEALQELRHVADLAGISQERFDQSLLVFNSRLGDLQLRSGPLFNFLRDYNRGLLFAMMRTRDTTQAFTLFAEAVRRAPTAGIQAALTREAFGGGGRRMVNLLRGGVAGLAAGRMQARETLTIQTEEMVRRIERLDDERARAQAAFNSKMIELINNVVVKIEPLIDRINTFLGERESDTRFGNLLRRGINFIQN